MARLWVVALFVSAGAAAQPVMKLAAPGLSAVDIDASKVAFFTEQLASAMAGPRLRVVTQKEIATMIGLERQRQLLGCSDPSAQCMAELAGALGVDGIVIGDVAKLGGSIRINLKVIAASDGHLLTKRSEKVTREEDVADALERLGREMAGELTGEPAAGGGVSLRTLSFVPLGLGVAAAITGAVLLGLARGPADQLDTAAHLSLRDAVALHDQGVTLQTAGAVALGTGVAVAVAGAVLFAIGGKKAQPVVFFTPGGAGVGFAGAWP